ncbi:hypothetical protein BDN72DRAFT_883408 [Pluteus cervinus]|uniref:Uncharacterized protein n=1 Tax=Pluteus cervinus TaxID=181527 RepID=A0ACD3A5G3_9AGAR|nr:hypothetical protein BDN72DRAFT_883408 [Pluteus cervinus]
MDDDFERYEEPRARKTGKGWNKGKKNNDDDDYIDAQERKTRKKIQAKAHTKAQRGKKKGKKDEIPYEPLLPSHLVPAPSPEFLNQGFLFYPESQIRSPEALLQRFIANGYGRGLKCHKYAPVIQLPFTLEDLEANRLSYAELEEVCIELDKKEAQAMSAKFVDKNGRTLVYYCSRRQKSLSSQTIKFEDQYKNRTQKDLDAIPRQHIVHDGLDPDNPPSKNSVRYYNLSSPSPIVVIHAHQPTFNRIS